MDNHIHKAYFGSSNNYTISASAIQRVLDGISSAIKSEIEIKAVDRWLSSVDIRRPSSSHLQMTPKDPSGVTVLGINEWYSAIASEAFVEEDSRHLAKLALGVAFLREKSRDPRAGEVTSTELSSIWSLISNTLIALSRPLFKAIRSSQGFLAVPLHSITKDGNIDELIRLHVWVPDGQRGDSRFAIHSHQPFAQSWVLLGEGEDTTYKVESIANASRATHAEYALVWNDGTSTDTSYKTHPLHSVVVNMNKYVEALPLKSTIHTRDMSYTIDHATFHTSTVPPLALHATIFFFDAHRGFCKEAGVLGPVVLHSATSLRDAGGATPSGLARMADSIRSWEIFMTQGQRHARKAQWEDALRAFDSAMNLCDSIDKLPMALNHRRMTLSELASINRRFGRYEQAKDILETARKGMEISELRVEIDGELGVVYRHLNRLPDAKQAFEDQYNAAFEVASDGAMCRAIGNLGMVNFQISQQNKDMKLLETAMMQMKERIQRAHFLQQKVNSQSSDPTAKALSLAQLTTWEVIGWGRLTLMHIAHGDHGEAIEAGHKAVEIAKNLQDTTVVAFTGFLYGRALLINGQFEEAMRQFNPRYGCTPAIAFCKEPSDEHRQYLHELVDAGADMDAVDEQGYSGLDYAVFNNDLATQTILLGGLRKQLDHDVEVKIKQRQEAAQLRKGYRELFQEKLRPILLRGGEKDVLQQLRRVYHDTLVVDQEKSKMFDSLKCVRYMDFLSFGRLPRSSDGLARSLKPNTIGRQRDKDFIIFFSYRWINKTPGALTPDEDGHTQYRRMVEAAEQFMKLHPAVGPDTLSVWVDYACVNQDDAISGVSALPMIIAQCDAVVSLVDTEYYNRAWCSVEVLIVQVLKRSYSLHMWYEQILLDSKDDCTGRNPRAFSLKEAPMDLEIEMADKMLSVESDRPKVMFLQKQSRLLG